MMEENHHEGGESLNQYFRWRQVSLKDLWGVELSPKMDDGHEMSQLVSTAPTYHRLVGQWVFEVCVIIWSGSHDPSCEWKVFRKWKTEPDQGRIDKAMAAALNSPRFFNTCTMCNQLNITGHMHSPKVCSACAELGLGIVH